MGRLALASAAQREAPRRLTRQSITSMLIAGENIHEGRVRMLMDGTRPLAKQPPTAFQ
jgi:hypothetical protein